MLRPVVTIDASMSLQNALTALAVYPPTTFVVIRRREGEKLYWYIKHVGDIRLIAAQVKTEAHASVSVAQAFGLHEYQASPSFQVKAHTRLELTELSGILLDGERVVGVLEPRSQRASRGAGPDHPTRPVPGPATRDWMLSMKREDAPPPVYYKMSAPAPREEMAPPTSAEASEPGTRSGAGRMSDVPPSLPPPGRDGVPASPPAASMRRRAPKNGGGEPAPSPFKAYPRLCAPDSITQRKEFTLSVGLAAQQQAGTAGGEMTVATAKEKFDLIIQVVAPDFEAPEGIRRTLRVKRSEFEKAVTSVKLVAPVVRDVLLSTIEVQYSYLGNLVGRAWREIRVVAEEFASTVPEARTGATPVGLASPVDAPDLTVTINRGLDDSLLSWAFTTPHTVNLPAQLVTTKFPNSNAQTFAIDRIRSVADYDGSPLIDNKVKGLARIISNNMPREFWNVLGEVWAYVRKERGQVPTLFLVSEDPYVPWELASTEPTWVVDQSLVDSKRPPILGAQLKIGRWLKQNETAGSGIPRPKLPPDTSIDIKKMALVVGDYLAMNGQRELPEAKEEGKELSNRYPSIWVDGEISQVNHLLDNKLKERGEPVSVQAVHFASHGEVSPESRYNGIILSDSDLRLGEDVIAGNDMTSVSEPFVFVNACQLGQASEILGDYGGLAGAFLREGCRGFVAPLWSVDDKIAREFAIQFYKRTLDENTEVSEVMRELRSRFDMSLESPPSTFLAYVFYGHPKLMLRKAF